MPSLLPRRRALSAPNLAVPRRYGPSKLTSDQTAKLLSFATPATPAEACNRSRPAPECREGSRIDSCEPIDTAASSPPSENHCNANLARADGIRPNTIACAEFASAHATRAHSRFAALPRLDMMERERPPSGAALTPSLVSATTTASSSPSTEPTTLEQLESPIAHARRGPPQLRAPSMRLMTSCSSHRLDIPLPKPGGQPFAPEMVTIAAMKGDRLDIVADAWHLEENCHFEWHVAFPPKSVDMATVRAEFSEEGHLAISVRRTRSAETAERPRVF